VHPLDDLEDDMLDAQGAEGEASAGNQEALQQPEGDGGGDADLMDDGQEEEEEEEELNDDGIDEEEEDSENEDVGHQDQDRRNIRGWQRLGQGYGNRMQFIHALYGGAVANSNEELVAQLQLAGNIRSQKVKEAFLACPRASFVPPQYLEEAYLDSPIRLDHLGFNISAPHMHAMCIEQLDVQPGHWFLDIGCGCGVVSAIAAHLVGPSGGVVGYDILPEAVKLSTRNFENLWQDTADYARLSCQCHFEEHNVFLPHPTHRLFDRICVGAQCHLDQLPSLLKLLRPSGGVMVVPVGCELKLITRLSSGKMLEKVIANVRFGELVLPSDARIVLETLKVNREVNSMIALPESTLEQDMAEASGCSSRRDSPNNNCSSNSSSFSTRKGLFSPSSDHGNSAAGSFDALGACDCALLGQGWSAPAHMSLLKVRSQHFRARFESGMRDAEVPEMPVPDHFSKETVEAFLHYVYHDSLPDELPIQEVAELVHAAMFFNSQRLVVLCEAALAKELRSKESGVEELAPQLLLLADEVGLQHLRNAALNYITQKYSTVSQTAGFHLLSKDQVAMVAQTACQYYTQAIASLEEITGTPQAGIE